MPASEQFWRSLRRYWDARADELVEDEQATAEAVAACVEEAVEHAAQQGRRGIYVAITLAACYVGLLLFLCAYVLVELRGN